MTGIRVGIIVLACLTFGGTSATAVDWESWTSYGEAVRRIRTFGDTTYVVSSGGVLVIGDSQAEGRGYTNLNGPGTTEVTDIIQAADDQIWVTGFGRLIKFNGIGSERFIFADNEGTLFSLYCVKDDGDRLWVGTERGLILFSKTIDGGLILDNYNLFGNLPGSPVVFDLEMVGDSIYLATDLGVAVADRSVPTNLKAPANWVTFDPMTHPEMASAMVTRIVAFDGVVYAGTSGGLYRLDVDADTLVRVSATSTMQVTDLKIESDSLFYYSNQGHGIVEGDVLVGLATSGVPGYALTGTHLGLTDWMASSSGGLYWSTGGPYTRYTHEGLPGNNVRDVSIADNGLITALLYNKGPYELHDDLWVKRTIAFRDHTNGIDTDRSNRAWVGTWGAGVSMIGDSISRYTNQNSTLRGVSENPNYVVVPDVVVTDDYAFFGIFRGIDGARVAVVDIDNPDELSGWTVFGSGDGIIGERIAVIDEFAGALAIGSQENGLYYYYYGSDPFSKQDDSLAHYYEDSPNFRRRINSDVIRAVRFSPSGEMWVGTNFGLTRYDPGIELFVDIILPAGFGPEITAIDFDSRGNAWVGAINGLAFIDAVDGTIDVYTARTSGLITDFIVALTIDDHTGDLYVSTGGGISIVKSSIGRPTEDIDSVFAFPNPYVIDSPDDILNFNFAGQATLRVFTVAGELVAERPEPRWDGRNQNGEAVVSGVYIFVLNDSQGRVGKGKILLVRN